jgi:CRISPR system Cascade subunit CasE
VKSFLTQALVDHVLAAKYRIYHHGHWHRCVWEAFNPVEGDHGKRGFLYSVEETPGGYRVLILSESVPTRPDWCPVPGWATKVIPAGFLSHTRYAFSLTANPTRDLVSGQRVSLTQRIGPDDEPEPRLLDWLERKGSQGGFKIYRGKTVAIPGEIQKFSTSDKSQQITLHYVRYQGVLEVTNLTLFQQSFHSGIGRGRAFGAGMLLLKPIN